MSIVARPRRRSRVWLTAAVLVPAAVLGCALTAAPVTGAPQASAAISTAAVSTAAVSTAAVSTAPVGTVAENGNQAITGAQAGAGMGFGAMAVHKFRQHKENPVQH